MQQTDTLTKIPFFRWRPNPDRIGVTASVLCAIHCAVTPVFFLLAPSFGRVWAHPASHWLVALLVVPLAAVALLAGFRRHGRRWILGAGILGMSLVIAGAAIPYLESGEEAAPAEAHAASAGEPSGITAETEFVYVVGEEEDDVASEATCPDACCPTLTVDEQGNRRLQIPLASIVTTFGGLALILTHLGNLRCCRTCRNQRWATL
jgi:hypothetical protein